MAGREGQCQLSLMGTNSETNGNPSLDQRCPGWGGPLWLRAYLLHILSHDHM